MVTPATLAMATFFSGWIVMVALYHLPLSSLRASTKLSGPSLRVAKVLLQIDTLTPQSW